MSSDLSGDSQSDPLVAEVSEVQGHDAKDSLQDLASVAGETVSPAIKSEDLIWKHLGFSTEAMNVPTGMVVRCEVGMVFVPGCMVTDNVNEFGYCTTSLIGA